MAKRIKVITIFILIGMITFGNFSALAQHPGGTPGGEEETETFTFNGYCDVGSSVEESFSVERSISKVEFALMWEDDEGSNSQPDTLSLMTTDGMHEPKSDSGSEGMIGITWEEDRLNDTWTMVISCESAGPTEVPVGPLGVITQTESDPGNSWTLIATVTYSSGMGGGPPANVQAVLDSPVFKVHIALMVMSVFLFLGTGLVAGVFGYNKIKGGASGEQDTLFQKLFARPDLMIFLVIITFTAFFIAAIPIGIWVAGNFYGWNKAWTGFPLLWNPEAYSMTNADNVSFLILFFWAVPMYINRAQIMRNKYFKKLFGWSKFAMGRAAKAPDPKISNGVLALCYFFMGIFTFVIFMVQPHGSG